MINGSGPGTMAGTTDAFGRPDADGASDSAGSDMAGVPGGELVDGLGLSPEDAAWVDSCLLQDDGDYLSDESWAALTEAFITALASASAGDGSQAADAAFEQPSSPTASTLAPNFHDQPSPTTTTTPLGDSGAHQSEVAAAEGGIVGNNGGLNAAAVVMGLDEEYYPVGRGYEGDARDESLPVAAGEEVDEFELTKDVFRVWELDVTVTDEEDEDEEFSWQVNKALEEESPQGKEALDEWKAGHSGNNAGLDEQRLEEYRGGSAVLGDGDLEELVAGINDMALGPPPSAA
uniref:Lipase 2 n=2 Tax=Anthurium amnicola TaxID=1678845 RepID=A0A1D1XQ79_9ARAE